METFILKLVYGFLILISVLTIFRLWLKVWKFIFLLFFNFLKNILILVWKKYLGIKCTETFILTLVLKRLSRSVLTIFCLWLKFWKTFFFNLFFRLFEKKRYVDFSEDFYLETSVGMFILKLVWYSYIEIVWNVPINATNSHWALNNKNISNPWIPWFCSIFSSLITDVLSHLLPNMSYFIQVSHYLALSPNQLSKQCCSQVVKKRNVARISPTNTFFR